MNCDALATDYDGTIAHEGKVHPVTLEALQNLRHSGRKLILVTGRELADLMQVFPPIEIFDRVIAENGALLYRPDTHEKELLAPAPSPQFAEMLRQKGVHPLSIGHIIVATVKPHETTVLTAIRDLGLELQVIFNKESVMVLPSGVNKATGLVVALQELGLSGNKIAGVGDAENDHSFLEMCGYSAALANAVPLLQEKVDWVADHPNGLGVQQLIEMILSGEMVRESLDQTVSDSA